jgi:hypothetical protein
MSASTVPHDLDAERALIAAMLVSPAAAENAVRAVTAADIYSPLCRAMFEAIVRLRASASRPDATTVADDLRRINVLEAVGGPGAIADVAAFPASTATTDRYAAIVVEHALRRRLIAVADSLHDAALAGEPYEVLDAHRERLSEIDVPKSGNTDGLMLVDELIDRPPEHRSPWVVEGLLRRDWRAMVVAAEGVGKSLVLQQIALCAAQGLHPFTLKTGYRPVTTLLIDAENSEDRIVDGCTPIRSAASRIADWSPQCWLWHRPGGLDLRTRRDRSALENVLRAVRPELVCGGPVYKLAERQTREGWDEGARALQSVLDDFRTRFRFAVLLEDHAPQATGGTRDLRPFGSSLWLRWPELGIKLVRKDSAKVAVDHWRGARLKHSWPDELHRGAGMSMPWIGYWRSGMEKFS